MVSVLGFGCMRLPVINGVATEIDDVKAIAMLHHAIDEGVNYVDTAYPYHGEGSGSGGASEPFVGRALRDGYRERVKLATKLPSWLIKSREDMDKYLNEQLQRLETDTIDFYLVHALNAGTWRTLSELGIGEFLDQAIQDGRIRHAGFSFHDELPLFKEIVDSYNWSFCQIQYNYLDENFQAGTEGLVYASAKDLGIAIMEPLRGGTLAKNIPAVVQQVFDQSEVKRSPAEWALRWVWNHPEVDVSLSGMNNMEQVVENLKISDDAQSNSLTVQELDIIMQAEQTFANNKVDCTGCNYCMPCPVGVDIPRNFSYYNEYFFLDSADQKNALKAKYEAEMTSEERAAECIECGSCEEECPQNIAIAEEMKNVAEVFV